MGVRDCEKPPFNLDGSYVIDERENWIGTKEAARLFGTCRTQAWRLGQKWVDMEREGDTPPVEMKVHSFGPKPELKFQREQATHWGRERQSAKAIREMERAQDALNFFQELVDAGEIGWTELGRRTSGAGGEENDNEG